MRPKSMRPDPVRSLAVLDAVRGKNPQVHCLTNSVARAFTANVLLAVGAVPLMSHDAAEVGAFVTKADALLVNLGTLDPAMRAAMMTALDVAQARRLPWVLDPVFADRSAGRAAFATELLARRPAALRLNEAEAAALGAGATDAARLGGEIVALSGEIDQISSLLPATNSRPPARTGPAQLSGPSLSSSSSNRGNGRTQRMRPSRRRRHTTSLLPVTT